MEVMIETCCGIDVHPKSIVCCILDGPLDTNKPKKIQKKLWTTTVALHNALDWVVENHVTHVFFESTGQYWLPLFNIFSDSDLVLVLANPQHIKNVPGLKTDMKDAEWIAQLGRCGLTFLALNLYPETSEVKSRRTRWSDGRKVVTRRPLPLRPELILIQTMSASPWRTQVQPAASFLVCSLIFIEY